MLSGVVRTADGAPVGGAELDFWQCNAEGRLYDTQLPGEEPRYRGRLRTEADGRYEVRTIVVTHPRIDHYGMARLLRGADPVLGGPSPAGIASPVNFHHGFDDDPLGQYLDALERIETLAPQLVLPGHGRPFTAGARRARAIIESKERRMAQTLQAIEREALTVKEITERVYAKAVLSYQIRMALSEALAQLACLRKRGAVVRSRREDGAVVFQKQDRGR